MKVHVKNTDQEVADTVITNCLRKPVPAELHSHLQKRARIVLCRYVRKYIIDRVNLRLIHDANDDEGLLVHAVGEVRDDEQGLFDPELAEHCDDLPGVATSELHCSEGTEASERFQTCTESMPPTSGRCRKW